MSIKNNLILINTTYRNSIKSVMQLFFSTFLGSILVFLIQIILARILGTTLYGVFSSSLAIVTLGIPLALFGIPQLWLKLYAKEGMNANRWLSVSFKYIFLSTLMIFTLLYLWAFLGNNDSLTSSMIVILSFYILGQISIELVSSKLQLEGRYLYLSIWQSLPHLIRFLLIILIFIIYEESISIIYIGYAYISVSILVFIAGIIHLKEMIKCDIGLKSIPKAQLKIDIEKVGIKHLLKNSWPFGFAGFFYLIYFQSDIYLIKYILNDSLAGIYNAAFIVMIAVYMFPNVLYQKFLLPKLHLWSSHDKEKFYDVYNKGTKIMFILGLLAMVLIWLLSDIFITFVFGVSYAEAIPALNILAISAPMVFMSFSMGAILTTQEYIKIKVKCMGIVAILNVILNLSIIPSYGIIGAAMTTVFSNFILLILFYVSVKKYVFK